MKERFTSFVLFFIMIILILGICGIGYYIYNDLTDEEIAYKPVETIISEEPSNKTNEQHTTENVTVSESIQSILNSTNGEYSYEPNEISKFFYNQLDETQKILYDGLQSNKENLKKGDYVINYGKQFTDILSEENGGEKLGDDYQTAIEAFLHDNPDLFYLDVNKMYLNIRTTTRFFHKTHEIYVAPEEGTKYLQDGFTDISQIEYGIQATEKIKNYVLENLKGSDYQKIQAIHNYLVDSIEYDSSYNTTGTYGIYGALITRKCVCEGYAKAFKYLTNAAGFECEIMQGTATNSKGVTENHAWNCIKIDNKWYEVDTTWDDPIVVGLDGTIMDKLTSDSLKYKFFLKGSNTFNEDHKIEYHFSENGKDFEYPPISVYDYRR